jgi:hypothetical protein
MSGKHTDRQRPSAPATEVQVGGTALPKDSMNVSGVQNPAPAPDPHAASSDCSAAGTSADGTQWAPMHDGEHAGNDEGSMSGGPV